MDNEKIIEILNSWNLWKESPYAGIERREYLNRLDKLSKTEQIVAIVGVRRSGKSTLMRQFIKKKILEGHPRNSFLYVNFEEPRFSGMLSLDFLQQVYDAYLEILNPKGKPWIFLDEVQNVPAWEKFVRSLHEKKEANIFVSGSTSKLISKELGEILTGRWVELKTFPLDFQEFLTFKGLKIENRLDLVSNKVRIKQLFREYIEFGGFPLAVLKEEKEDILRTYFEDIIGRDIVLRNDIRKGEKLRSLARYYLTNFASPHSYRKIAKFLGLSLDSVERFSDYMKDAYLLFFVPRFSYSLKEQEISSRVVYGIDSGLINITGFRFTDNLGRLYENTVCLSLVRQRKEIYYYKENSECDFVIKDHQKVAGVIQVCYNLTEQNKQREIKGLISALNAFNLKEGIIITEDKEGEEIIEKKKIVYTPIWKWLLSNPK